MNDYLTDEEYENIYSKVPRACVDIVIKLRDKFLLIERTTPPNVGTWHLPGGQVRMRETVKDAVKRICKIEAGIEGDIELNLIGYMDFTDEEMDTYTRHSISMAFEVIGAPTKGEYRRIDQGNIMPIHLRFLKSL